LAAAVVAAAVVALLEVTGQILSSARSQPSAAVVAAPTMTRMDAQAVRVAAVATARTDGLALKGRRVGTRARTATETKAASVPQARGTEAGAAVLAGLVSTAHLQLVATADLGTPRTLGTALTVLPSHLEAEEAAVRITQRVPEAWVDPAEEGLAEVLAGRTAAPRDLRTPVLEEVVAPPTVAMAAVAAAAAAAL